MNKELLNAFLKQEATDHVRKLLLRKISECRTGAATGQHRFDFNRFIITIDCDSRRAVIEDDLTSGAAGESILSIDDFASMLWSSRPPRQ